MIKIISYLIVALLAYFFGYFIAPNSKNKKAKQELEKIETEYNQFQLAKKLTQNNIDNLNNSIAKLEQDCANLTTEKNIVVSQLIKAQSDLESIQNNTKNAQEYQEHLLQVTIDKNNIILQQIEKDNQVFLKDYDNDLAAELKRLSNNFQTKFRKILSETQQYQDMLDEAKRNVDLAVEANRRAYEQEQQKDFYKIKLPQQDITEIRRLKEITAELRNPEALNKVIWRVYYQNPTGDLINRVLGREKHCGIYRITNILNGMTYIGQSVDCAARWIQHIKRGLGAEPTTRNKLYPALAEIGPENFTFELLEDCPREQLNDREKFWIDYYHGQDFGYNETSGG